MVPLQGVMCSTGCCEIASVNHVPCSVAIGERETRESIVRDVYRSAEVIGICRCLLYPGRELCELCIRRRFL